MRCSLARSLFGFFAEFRDELQEAAETADRALKPLTKAGDCVFGGE